MKKVIQNLTNFLLNEFILEHVPLLAQTLLSAFLSEIRQ